MENIEQKILTRINAIVAAGIVTKTAFGKQAVGDPNLYDTLCEGREMRRKTREKVLQTLRKIEKDAGL